MIGCSSRETTILFWIDTSRVNWLRHIFEDCPINGYLGQFG